MLGSSAGKASAETPIAQPGSQRRSRPVEQRAGEREIWREARSALTQIIDPYVSACHVFQNKVSFRAEAKMRKYLTRYLVPLVLATTILSVDAIAQDQNPRLPSLSDLMVITQLRQFKLWYSERADNWKLAAYQYTQLENTLRRIVALYPETSNINQSKFVHDKIEPALVELRRAVSDENKGHFEVAYQRVTDMCNECHQAAGVGFIVVRVPTKSPFSNQEFAPTP
jgi:hypothetical protein